MPYSKINPDDMILRDHLAYDRTVLANERTLLAYIRTTIAQLAAGATLLYAFPEDGKLTAVGYFLIVMGVLTAIAGLVRFYCVIKRLAQTHKKPGDLPTDSNR